jgi:hypothetical protein
MQEIKRFQIRGVPGEVVRARFADRIVDYWMPRGGSEHLLIAHDGQNVFDGTTSTHRRQTWKMAQSAIDVANEQGIKPPTIIGVWHSSTKENPWGRAKDLAPEKFFTSDSYVDPRWAIKDPTVVVPTIPKKLRLLVPVWVGWQLCMPRFNTPINSQPH